MLVDDEAAPDAMARVFAYGPDMLDEREVPGASERVLVGESDVESSEVDGRAGVGVAEGLHDLEVAAGTGAGDFDEHAITLLLN